MNAYSSDLRTLAERRLRHSSPTGRPPPDLRLQYELDVHREELEIQNEELRATQLELKAARDHYADLYDFAPVGYLTLDSLGTITEANLTACQMLNRERSRLIGLRLAAICRGKATCDLVDHFRQVLETRERGSCEIEFKADDTSYLRLETAYAVENAAKDYSFRTVLTDVSDRRRAELLAAEHQKRFQSLANALPLLVSYLDSKLIVRFSNAAHRDWFGAGPEEFVGRPLAGVTSRFLSGDLVVKLGGVLSGRRVAVESTMNHANLGSRQAKLEMIPDFGEVGVVQGAFLMCTDISEQNIVEKQQARRRSLDEKLERLSADERLVYEQVMRGMTNKVIALELDIGMRTVERRRRAILDKLEVDSIAALLQQFSVNPELDDLKIRLTRGRVPS